METKALKEITNIEDIRFLVDTFYDKIRQDDLLAEIFYQRILDRWPEHLQKMYTFWETILLGKRTYSGAPFVPHATMDVYQEHFDRWLSLWYSTLDEHFTGRAVDEAKWRGNRMAEMFLLRINRSRENGTFWTY